MSEKLKILVACEFSGQVRDAFIDLGHNAISCDLLPCESVKYTDPSLHYQGDVMDIIDNDYDLMIAHPPCTFMTNAGVRWLYTKDVNGNTTRNEPRWQSLYEASTFFLQLYNANIPHICIENPIMHKHAKALIGINHSQIIQPYQYNEPYQKATCLWLKNLPLLKPVSNLTERNQAVWKMGPSPDRWKKRSITYKGIAQQIALQWSEYILNE